MKVHRTFVVCLLLVLMAQASVMGDDWLRWRVPIANGHGGPTVADWRVHVTDRVTHPDQAERAELTDLESVSEGNRKISRAQRVKPTAGPLSQRGGVCGVPPAFADGRIYARNDETPVSTNPSSYTESAPGQTLHPPVLEWFPVAPPLEPPQGDVIPVSNVRELIDAIEDAKTGQTILVEDGHYFMPRYVEIRADDVTLRSASGHRERVILDGVRSQHGELLGVRSCSGVTIADLTIQNVRWNGFKINSQTGVQRLTIHNCIIHNIWQRGVKGVKVPPGNRAVLRPKQCRIQYCLFYNDRPKQLTDDAADIAQGNYIAGIDVMYAKDWVISDNVFVGIQGRTGEGRGAIFLWFDAQDCVVERNIIIDCDVGLQLGNPHRADGVQVHCVRCVARNNFITRAPEAGIVAVYTKDCRVLHNTIHDPDSQMGRLIRTVFANNGLIVANNLLSGPAMSHESSSAIRFQDNLLRDMTYAFVNPAGGDLHLTEAGAGAVPSPVRLPEVQEDIDRERRGTRSRIGADEPSVPGRVTGGSLRDRPARGPGVPVFGAQPPSREIRSRRPAWTE